MRAGGAARSRRRLTRAQRRPQERRGRSGWAQEEAGEGGSPPPSPTPSPPPHAHARALALALALPSPAPAPQQRLHGGESEAESGSGSGSESEGASGRERGKERVLLLRRRDGLIDITLRTMKLMRRNQQLQHRLLALQAETRAFVRSVLSNPENRVLRPAPSPSPAPAPAPAPTPAAAAAAAAAFAC